MSHAGVHARVRRRAEHQAEPAPEATDLDTLRQAVDDSRARAVPGQQRRHRIPGTTAPGHPPATAIT